MVNMSSIVSNLLPVSAGSGDGRAERREASGHAPSWPLILENSITHAVIAELTLSHTFQAVSLGAGTYE